MVPIKLTFPFICVGWSWSAFDAKNKNIVNERHEFTTFIYFENVFFTQN